MRLYPLIVMRQIKGCVNAASDEVDEQWFAPAFAAISDFKL